MVVGITTFGRKGESFWWKQFSSAPGCGARTQTASSAGSRCRAPSPGGYSAALGCPTGGPAPALPFTLWMKGGGGRKVKGECGWSLECWPWLASQPRAHPGFLTCGARGARSGGAHLRFVTAVPPQSQPKRSVPPGAGRQQLGGRERRRLLRGSVCGSASPAQGAAIWSLAAGGARVLGTRPCPGDPRPWAAAGASQEQRSAATAPRGLGAGRDCGRASVSKV